MKTYLFGFFLLITSAQFCYAQSAAGLAFKAKTPDEQAIINLSKKKWDWMADKHTDSLNLLFDDKAILVHMGGSRGKAQELNVIKSGGI